MNHQISIRQHNLLIGIGRASTLHAMSNHGLPVIVVSKTDPYYGDAKRQQLLSPGVYGPADLPPDSVIHDLAANATPQWWQFEDVAAGLIAAGYTIAD